MNDALQRLIEQHERVRHREHQLVGVDQLVKTIDLDRAASWNGLTWRREIPNVFGLLDEVGAGKTKQCVDTSQVLFLRKELDTVLVFTPGYARSTWASDDPTLGEVAKHAWSDVPNVVHEFHGSYTDLDLTADALHWIVTNYEFVRRDEHRDELLKLLKGRRVWIIADESWCIKGRSDQTRAVTMIRRKRGDRATILNGTPLSDGKPQDVYYQFNFLDPDIIGCKNYTHFKTKYLVTGGGTWGKQVIGYQNLDELNARIAPYVLSRRTRDCFDLPPMLDPVTIEFKLTDATWKIYREMRDEMVAWLGTQASMSKQGIVKVLRLAQITSGFLGGLEDVDAEDLPVAGEPTTQPLPPWLASKLPAQTPLPLAQPGPGPFGELKPVISPKGASTTVTREIGRERLDALLKWLSHQALPERMLFWCRFRPELERLTRELGAVFPKVLNLKGGQRPEDREAAKRLLAPGSTEKGAVVGNQKAGGASLNFAGAPWAVYVSNGPALIDRTQSLGRTERPGATQPMLVVDMIATGPKGQKTFDHHNLHSLRTKQDMATFSVNRWRALLEEE